MKNSLEFHVCGRIMESNMQKYLEETEIIDYSNKEVHALAMTLANSLTLLMRSWHLRLENMSLIC